MKHWGDKRTDKQPGRLGTLAHSEFCAQVSLFELYNEELFASGSNSGPRKDGEAMKMDANTALRIFDDTLKEVFWQNWNDILLKICLYALNLIDKALLRRKTAETKLNQASSTRHCIFTI